MAKPELIASISQLSNTIDRLLKKQEKMTERIRELEVINEELRNQHLLDSETIQKYEKKIEFLSLSHRLASSPEALIQARKMISGLIRTVDNCIQMINED